LKRDKSERRAVFTSNCDCADHALLLLTPCNTLDVYGRFREHFASIFSFEEIKIFNEDSEENLVPFFLVKT
jgi:hypothetical protein